MEEFTATAAEINKLDGLTATTTELNYVDGVTSSIQTQLDGKAASSHNHSAANITSGTLSADRLATSGATAGSYGPSANASPGSAGTFSVPYLTVDNKGRVTAASTKTITMPTVSSGGMSLSSNVTVTTSTHSSLTFIDTRSTSSDNCKYTSRALWTNAGVPAVTDTLQGILQRLVNISHTHSVGNTTVNCDCYSDGS